MTSKPELRSLIFSCGGTLLTLISILLIALFIYNESSFACLFIPIIILISVILPLTSLMSFSDDKARFAGKKLKIHIISMLISLTPIILIVTLALMYISSAVNQVTCELNLRGLAAATYIYAYDNNDSYPDPNKWCDLLILHADTGPRSFLCRGSDAVLGESSYAMNINLKGKRASDVDADTVLIFETDYGKDPNGRNEPVSFRYCYNIFKERFGEVNFFGEDPETRKVYRKRWNQSGGPELLTANHHEGTGSNILFADGIVRFVEKKDFNDLNWGNDTEKANIE